MADNRTVEQRLSAVAASMTMAGYTMTETDRAESRRILRGEVSADESVRRVLADAGRDAADLVGKTAFRRLSELESSRPLTVFTRETLLKTHAYLCGDVYPWAGTIRTSEVGAMGLAMCRAAYVDQELDRLFRRIEQSPPSATDREAALRTVAEHWGELTIIHPFLDGNSRTQRYFFDHMLRHAGWSLDWRRIAAAEVHAARYVAAATLDSSLLDDALRPGLSTGEDCPQLPTEPAAVLFHRMMEFRRAHPHESCHKLFFADKQSDKLRQPARDNQDG